MKTVGVAVVLAYSGSGAVTETRGSGGGGRGDRGIGGEGDGRGDGGSGVGGRHNKGLHHPQCLQMKSATESIWEEVLLGLLGQAAQFQLFSYHFHLGLLV